MSKIVGGHIDRESGKPCGWANGYPTCQVPGCAFAKERCILVQRETGRSAERPDIEDRQPGSGA